MSGPVWTRCQTRPLSQEFDTELVNTWIKKCDQKHSAVCSPPSEVLPTRILDVGSNEQPVLRLIDGKE
jgi:hypothetical protein